jgi:N-methylhydantoinase A
MASRIGVDVGGTFTDLITYDDATGQVRVVKEPTTPWAPEEGVVQAMRRGVPPELLRAAAFFLHGTTVGLNALLERRGGGVGLLSTDGFRDVLEIGRGDRADPYDLFWRRPEPLVPRELRLPVTERVLADGSVLTPLEPADVRRALEVFREAGVASIAIAFLNSYVNPAHEREAATILGELGFDGELALSHEISGEYREYERTSTTVVDAFVRPSVCAYLERLESRLRELGFAGDTLVTRSGGGAMSFVEAQVRPFETILSGPVAGAQGAASLARELGIGEAISADVGGTSFDTCLIVEGRPQLLYEGRIVGLPVQTPWVDVRSIGAGGGSVAYVDVGGLLRVGPRSAGARPGPACYARDGVEPTVTDAALVLGMLGPGELAGGIALDRGLAVQALEQLGLGAAEEAARGVITIAAASMADAMREITVEQGRDPRQAVLVAFGGAGPLFATLLASELDVSRVVVPRYAGNFSAWGLLGADLRREQALTRISRLSDEGLAGAREQLDRLFAGLEGGESGDGAAREARLDLRYVGQEHTLTVSLPRAGGVRELRELFDREYDRTFGHSMEEEVEIVSLRATLTTPLPARSEQVAHAGAERPTAAIDAWSFSQGETLHFTIAARESLAPGAELAGPTILLEDTATTYLDAGFVARVHESGALFLEARR